MTTRIDRLRAALIAGLVLAGLGGCAALQPVDCAPSDWRSVGVLDGANGKARSYGERYAQCTGFDADAWQRGRDDGLSAYCTETRIYKSARIGLSFPQICAPFEAELAQAQAFGHRYWELDFEMWKLRQRSRGDRFAGQRVVNQAEYNALRRERALYSRWPPLTR